MQSKAVTWSRLSDCHIATSDFVVRVIGLEPTCREAPDPKSGVSTNFTTPAGVKQKNKSSLLLFKRIAKVFFFSN